jgi:hypothetical protein
MNGTLTYQVSKANLSEVFGSEPTIREEILVGLLRHGMPQSAIPLPPRCDRSFGKHRHQPGTRLRS